MEKMLKKDLKSGFAGVLLGWDRAKNSRQLPWKGEKNPYKIWLSEIILQQTRVEQGLAYYERFIRVFPDIHRLAAAPEEKVIKLWEGLGYYSRCRNLIATAKYISRELKGIFPENYEAIRALKGVGPYTAAAISSFAFNAPYAVVDGNVFRVLSRVFGISKPIDSTKGKKYFSRLAESLLDKKQPGRYNQAIMDFGATVCKPVSPSCASCVFKKNCAAFRNGTINILPVKEKRTAVRKRWFYYLVLVHDHSWAIRKRTDRDIWHGLYEFPLLKAEKETAVKDVLRRAENEKFLVKKKYELLSVSSLHKQQLTHQQISGRFIMLRLKRKPLLPGGGRWVNAGQLRRFAFPQFINQYLRRLSASR